MRVFLLLLLSVPLWLYAQPTPRMGLSPAAKHASLSAPQAAPELEMEGVVWLTLEEALELYQKERRKLFVDVYTDWCSWCKKMDKTTFMDPKLSAYVNEHFYPVRFNAEQTEQVEFKAKVYKATKSGGRSQHELAVEWLQGRMTFPTVVFLDENLNLIQPIAGYQSADKLLIILQYFATDSHKTTPWEVFEKKQ
jgi:thioredoxin-related protein